MSESEIVLRYTPAEPGLYFHGVPQRDLTEEDLMDLPIATLRDLTASGVYTTVKRAEPPKANIPPKPSTMVGKETEGGHN